MFKKQINERSPMRVFERSIHGGLGKGNVGVVLSRAGIGKTAFLVDIALDDLMRERHVLHVNIDDPVEKVRNFYDEIFTDLAESMKLESRDRVHLNVERHRLIQTFAADSFSLEKLRNGITMAADVMKFSPDVIILDGYPRFSEATEDDLLTLKDIAKTYDVELWVSGRARREDEVDERGVPTKVARFDEYLSVIVKLEPEGDSVRLQLIKDHDNQDVASLFLHLDPKTLLVKWN